MTDDQLRAVGGILVLLFVLVKIASIVVFILVTEYGWGPL
jgi:hypothetical protein